MGELQRLKVVCENSVSRVVPAPVFASRFMVWSALVFLWSGQSLPSLSTSSRRQQNVLSWFPRAAASHRQYRLPHSRLQVTQQPDSEDLLPCSPAPDFLDLPPPPPTASAD